MLPSDKEALRLEFATKEELQAEVVKIRKAATRGITKCSSAITGLVHAMYAEMPNRSWDDPVRQQLSKVMTALTGAENVFVEPVADERAQVFSLVLDFFEGDEEKTKAWMTQPNPLLGGILSPNEMVVARPGKLLKLVRQQLDENAA